VVWGLTIAPSVLAVLTRLLSEHLHGSVCRAEKSGAPWDRFVADSAPEVDPSTGSSPTDALGEIVNAWQSVLRVALGNRPFLEVVISLTARNGGRHHRGFAGDFLRNLLPNRFATDSPLEGAGFEHSVPREIGFVSRLCRLSADLSCGSDLRALTRSAESTGR
jgi:hypothetical protein